jgi:hypothetical protein
MNQAIFKQQINKLQDSTGDVYCKIREARGILEILDEQWGYNDPPIDVQYAYLGVKSILKLGEDLADQLEHDLTTLLSSVAPLLPEYEDGFEDDDEQTPEWDDDAQMDLPIQDEEGNTIIINASHADDDYWTSQDSK